MKRGKGFAKGKKRARIEGANYPEGEGSEVADQGLEVQPISYSSGSSKTLETTEGEERQNHAAANQGGQPAEAAPNPAEALPTEVPGAEAMPTENSAQGIKRPSKKAGKEGVKKRRKATIPGENSEQPAEAMPTENSAQGSKRPGEEAGNQTKRARTENSNQNATSAGTESPISAAKEQLNISKKLLSALRPGQSIRRVVNLLKQLADPNVKIRFGNKSCDDIKPVLVWAAHHNNTKAVELILKKGACPDGSDNNGETALMKAARNGNLEIVELLLNYSARVDAKSNSGYTALLFAADYWSRYPYKIAQLLLEKGANSKVVNEYGETALRYASDNAEATQFFLNLKVDPNIVDKYGMTALCYAVKSPNAEAAKALLESGALPDWQNEESGNTVLMNSVYYYYNIEVVKVLLDYGADINIKNKNGMTALDLIAGCAHSPHQIKTEIINLIITSVCNPEQQKRKVLNPDAFLTLSASGVLNRKNVSYYITLQTNQLIQAQLKLNQDLLDAVTCNQFGGVPGLLRSEYDINSARRGDFETIKFETIKFLVTKGANVNAAGYYDGKTALMYAAESGDFKIIEFLVTQGANVNAKNNHDQTPLMHAAESGDFKIIEFLLERGAYINAADKDGSTALFYAALFKTGMSFASGEFQAKKRAAVSLLLKSGADVNAADKYGQTVLVKLACLPNTYNSPEQIIKIIELIITSVLSRKKENPDALAVLVVSDVLVHPSVRAYLEHSDAPQSFKLIKEEVKRTDKLMKAAFDGQYEEVLNLLDDGVYVNALNKDRVTALMYAAHHGHTDIVKLLLERGANVNAKNNYSQTALMSAARHGHTDIVKLLLERGADVNALNKDNWTALISAALNTDLSDDKKIQVINLIISFALLNQGRNPQRQNPAAFVTLLVSKVLNMPQVLHYISPQIAILIAAMGVDADSPLSQTPEMKAIADFIGVYNNDPLRQQNPANRIDQTIVNSLRALRDKIAKKSSSGQGRENLETQNQISLDCLLKANKAIADPAFLAVMFQVYSREILESEAAKLKAEVITADMQNKNNLLKRCNEIAALVAENVLESDIERLRNIYQVIDARLQKKAPSFKVKASVIIGNLTFFKLLDLTARKKPEQAKPDLSALDPELAFALKMWNKLKEEFEAQAQAQPTVPSDQASIQTRAAAQADITMAVLLSLSGQERKAFFNYVVSVGKKGYLQAKADKKELLDKYIFEEEHDIPKTTAAKNIKDFFHNGQLKEEYKNGFTPDDTDKYIALFIGGKKKLWPLSENLSDSKISAKKLWELLYLINDTAKLDPDVSGPVLSFLINPAFLLLNAEENQVLFSVIIAKKTNAEVTSNNTEQTSQILSETSSAGVSSEEETSASKKPGAAALKPDETSRNEDNESVILSVQAFSEGERPPSVITLGSSQSLCLRVSQFSK